MEETDETVEAVVCNINDLGKNLPCMKEVDVSTRGKCLLIRHEDGDLTALGHKCTHYGAPLARGALSKNTVRCPWHGACFNSRTGDIEDFPGLDSLQKYQVSLDKKTGDITVKAKVNQLKNVKRNSCYESPVDALGKGVKVVVIGGGPASLVFAETLRKGGFKGQITIICKESHLPYDRAKLSKALDAEPTSVRLRSDEDYFKNISVDFRLGSEVKRMDVSKHSVCLSTNDEVVPYDKLFIATGGKPRTLHPLPGWDSENIVVLRTIDDANRIASSARDKNVVLVGSSFIGMEIASYLAKKKESSSVSVVCGKRSKVPFANSLGEDIGKCIMKMHEDKGVKFHTSCSISELIVENEKVIKVKLTNNEVIDADFIILGIGVAPATDFLKESGVEMDEKGFIPVDCKMKTNLPDVYAGGDIVTFPLKMDGQRTNIQHWQMAHTHGKIAASGVLETYTKDGKSSEECVESVPFFWTVQYGISIRYAGHASNYTEVIIKGIEKNGKVVHGEAAIAAKKFAAFYVRDDTVVAVATMMADPIAARFAEKVKNDGLLKKSEIDSFLQGKKGTSEAESCNVS